MIEEVAIKCFLFVALEMLCTCTYQLFFRSLKIWLSKMELLKVVVVVILMSGAWID